MLTGVIHRGINNIYSVKTDTGIFECRIKGKQLEEESRNYNPLAPGDFVEIECDPIEPQRGLVVNRIERKNRFVRLNKKTNSPQIIAANVDNILCIASVASPPFRPRFVDRVLVSAHNEIPVLIVLNKTDLGIDDLDKARLECYRDLSYQVFEISLKNMSGINTLLEQIRGKRTVLLGQSGVGKSSLCNCISPELSLKIGGINRKYNRGNHTTCYSALYQWDNDSEIIDTPGIRELEIYGIESKDLPFYFREFTAYTDKCQYTACTHTHEPGCAIKDALSRKLIHTDRYESYVRIFEELDARAVR
ncbi:MAG: ribosome small subunit-dependent GTPase A [Spirochaetales bacterium]|nr:ribosome small subunit-dependent GTPase A [Spirochaetales bacterium]